MERFELEGYLSKGVEKIIKGILKSSVRYPEAGLFMMRYGKISSQARQRRKEQEAAGIHIPPFLIASITQQCNLHCKGCYARACLKIHSRQEHAPLCGIFAPNSGYIAHYAPFIWGKSPTNCDAHLAESNFQTRSRANSSCFDREGEGLLTAEAWEEIFAQAAELGMGFILLAGGEPLLRRDVLEAAGRQSRILFPVFTNGTMLDEAYLGLFSKHRNLLPVLSIEGQEETTDARRGEGVYRRLRQVMTLLREKGILYGVSVTVQKSNMEEVFSEDFAGKLADSGCRAVVYVEYVPMNQATRELAPDEKARSYMEERLGRLREQFTDLLFIAFPGDEKSSGGCLAAGRGFFHINAAGGAEPCPFSPFSDTSLKDVSLKEALGSPLFTSLRQSGMLTNEHMGGCVLFEQEEQVKSLLPGGAV